MEEEGVLPFLDVLGYQKEDGHLGHRVYRKPTHRDLYLYGTSCHHQVPQRAVLSTVAKWAHVVSDAV